MRAASAVGLAGVASAALLVASCGGGASSGKPASTAPARGPVSSPFGYRAAQPLGFRDAGRVNGPYPIAVHDVSFAAGSGRVQGYLLLPPRSGRLPAVIYLHGAGGDRSEFLVPAGWLAGRRSIGLTLTLPSSAAEPQPSGSTPSEILAQQQRQFVEDVVAVRRAVDLLRRRPDVDPSRIGLMGWSYGGKVGAVLAGVEPRIHSFVLKSGGATPVSEFVARAPAALRAEIRRVLTSIDPLRWIARAGSTTAILLQDGREDTVVPEDALLALAHAAPPGAVLRWYPAGHELGVNAYRDQLDWFVRTLRIRGPGVPGARSKP